MPPISATLATPVSDIVTTVVNPAWSLEGTTYASGSGVIYPGAVLALVNGKHQPVDFGGAGAEVDAAAVAYTQADATSADSFGVVLARGGVVDTAGLIWPVDTTAPQKTAALTQLKALGIVAKAAL